MRYIKSMHSGGINAAEIQVTLKSPLTVEQFSREGTVWHLKSRECINHLKAFGSSEDVCCTRPLFIKISTITTANVTFLYKKKNKNKKALNRIQSKDKILQKSETVAFKLKVLKSGEGVLNSRIREF